MTKQSVPKVAAATAASLKRYAVTFFLLIKAKQAFGKATTCTTAPLLCCATSLSSYPAPAPVDSRWIGYDASVNFWAFESRESWYFITVICLFLFHDWHSITSNTSSSFEGWYFIPVNVSIAFWRLASHHCRCVVIYSELVIHHCRCVFTCCKLVFHQYRCVFVCSDLILYHCHCHCVYIYSKMLISSLTTHLWSFENRCTYVNAL